MYTGPSLRNLGLSAVLHGAAIAALMNVSFISTTPEVRVEDVHATELRLNGKLYYVSQIDGANSAGSKSAAAAKAPGRKGGISAPRAAAAGKAPAPARPAIEAAGRRKRLRLRLPKRFAMCGRRRGLSFRRR